MTLYEKKKLTLRLDAQVIEKAKTYATNHDVSLSQIVELFLSNLITKSEELEENTELVKLLTGLVPQDIDLATIRDDRLQNKYNV